MLTPFSYISPVIRNLIIINGVIFLLGMLSPTINYYLGELFALNPAILFSMDADNLFGKPWSVFSYMFLHGSFFHLFANMFFGLWMFGESVARQIGEKEFLKLYLLSGTFAGALSAVLYYATGTNVSIIGASGATYAIMYYFCKFNPQATVLFMFVIPMKVKTLFIVLLAFEGFGALKNMLPQFGSDGVAHATHLFGLLGGFIFMKFIAASKSGNYSFQGSEESTFSNIADKVKQKFSGDSSKKDHDVHSPHGTNDTLDTILKKVSDYGVNALSEKEKQFLEKVSEQRRMQKGDNIRNLNDYK